MARVLNIEPAHRPREQSGKAVAAFLLGILSIVTSVLMVTFDSWLIFLGSLTLSIAAFALGIMARREILESDGTIRGYGLATWGTVSAVLGVATAFLLLPICWYVVDSINMARAHDRLGTISSALYRTCSLYRDRYPPAGRIGMGGKPTLSWRVLILPELGDQELYNEFDKEKPWDAPQNQALLERMPDCYKPVGGVECDPGHTFCQLLIGPGAVYESYSQPASPGEITDGPGETIHIVEAATAVPWTKPEDVMLDDAGNPPELGASFTGASSRFVFWLKPRDGYNAATADGRRVLFFPRDFPKEKLKKFITCRGNDKPNPEDWP